MDKCPRCGADMYGCGFYHCGSTDEGFDAQHPVEYVSNDCLRRQLAQRDSRIAELEAKLAAAARLANDSAEAAGEMAQCHGQVVPVELVEAIDLAFDGSNAHSDQWITNVRAAIKAALGGAM